jgi:hypothetical protein
MLISVNLKRKYDLAVFRHPSTEPDPQIQALLSPFVGRYDSEMAASYPTKEIAAQVAKRLNLNSMLGGWEVIPAEDVPKHQTPIR